MGKIREDEIVGAFVGGECVSWDHLNEDEKDAVTEDCLITQDDVEKGEHRYFCGRSKNQIR